MNTNSVFTCKLCGHCCQGRGGIIVSPKDLERLCQHLGLSHDAFASRYGEWRNGKLTVGINEQGFCIFFVDGSGCKIHEAKPDICRAWPFFRGNLIDPISLELAKDFCPGIAAKSSFEDFVTQGKAYLYKKGLCANDAHCEAKALIPTEISLKKK